MHVHSISDEEFAYGEKMHEYAIVTLMRSNTQPKKKKKRYIWLITN